MAYPDIETKADYERYKQDYERGVQGLHSLHAACDEDCCGDFSWRPCEICNRALGGDRHKVAGLTEGGDVIELSACVDCLHYTEYGHLDDMTMLAIERHAAFRGATVMYVPDGYVLARENFPFGYCRMYKNFDTGHCLYEHNGQLVEWAELAAHLKATWDALTWSDQAWKRDNVG